MHPQHVAKDCKKAIPITSLNLTSINMKPNRVPTISSESRRLNLTSINMKRLNGGNGGKNGGMFKLNIDQYETLKCYYFHQTQFLV